jgi:hypothetical protein
MECADLSALWLILARSAREESGAKSPHSKEAARAEGKDTFRA